MAASFPNAVTSVLDPPNLIVIGTSEAKGWCEQYSQEGYHVIFVQSGPGLHHALESNQPLLAKNKDVGCITFGLTPSDGETLQQFSRNVPPHLIKACIHYCPVSTEGKEFLLKTSDQSLIPTIFHIASSQSDLHAALQDELLLLERPGAVPTSEYKPLDVHIYPKVSSSPPFPFKSKPPALVVAGEPFTVCPYVRSATSLAYTRTLELLRRELGPHFDFEKLWEKHTYYEFVERDALKTMGTMVSVPYVNHVATMIGGLGYKDLARFYKHHFTSDRVTPPDTELITVSRTVGADRVIDEMVFKCTHTTELDYFLPNVKPTGKAVEIALVGVVSFRGDKLAFEHIYWDQASLLVQVGLLKPDGLPVAGVDVARKVLDPFGIASNALLARWPESENL